MAFGSYKTLGEAMAAFQVTGVREEFIQPKPFGVRDFFRAELETTLAKCPVECSEWAVCENLLYPVLREVALTYSDVLVVWSHVALYHDQELLGVPDYLPVIPIPRAGRFDCSRCGSRRIRSPGRTGHPPRVFDPAIAFQSLG